MVSTTEEQLQTRVNNGVIFSEMIGEMRNRCDAKLWGDLRDKGQA